MPRRVKRDEKVAQTILEGLRRVAAQEPLEEPLCKRADAGTLRVNFDTVAIESKVKRHLFDRPGTPYEPEHLAVAAEMSERGKVEPLRKQLDRSRAKLKISEARLGRSRTYAAQLLLRMQKMDLEIARIQEQLANGHVASEDEPLIGTGRVTALPPVARGRGNPRPKRWGTN